MEDVSFSAPEQGSCRALRDHSRLRQLSLLKLPESRRWVKGKRQKKVCAEFFSTLVTFSMALVNQVCLSFATLGAKSLFSLQTETDCLE